MLQIKCFHNSQSNLVRTDAHQISLILRKLERFFFCGDKLHETELLRFKVIPTLSIGRHSNQFFSGRA